MSTRYTTCSDEELIHALEFAGRNPPRPLLQACLDRSEALTPTMLSWLEAGSDPGWDYEDARWYREIHAGHLLIEWREPEALPLFEAIYRDHDRVDTLAEWFETRLVRYGPLATPMLLRLAANPAIGWGQICAIGTLGDLGQRHPEERTVILPVLRSLLPSLRTDGTLALLCAPNDVPDDDVERWTWVIAALMDLKDAESTPTVQALYDADLVDYTIIGDYEDYLQALNGPAKPRVYPSEELLAFYEPFQPRTAASGTQHQAASSASAPTQATPKPGRNAPCPCGSGRKYKHCCGKAS